MASLVKDHVHSLQCATHVIRVAHIALDKLRFGRNPARLPFEVGGRFQVIQDAHGVPAFQQEIHNVRANQARLASDKCF